MVEKVKSSKKPKEKVEKPKEKKKSKKDKSESSRTVQSAAKALSLLADDKTVDPTLSSLFAAIPTPPVRGARAARTPVTSKNVESDKELSDEDEDAEAEAEADEVDELGELDEELLAQSKSDAQHESKRKRKRKDEDDNLEDAYLQRIAREDARDSKALAADRAQKRQKNADGDDEVEEKDGDGEEELEPSDSEADEEDDADDDDVEIEEDEDVDSPPPRHETEAAVDNELAKANRTVFLGNVSTTAISSKVDRKTLLTHLKSFFPKLSAPKADEPPHAVESIRFRSTPYASAGPKKAAFAKKELMDATTKSTNAYAVYSSQTLAREAAKRLNGTIVLNRHLRVDEVSHPAKIDSKRCVFVGNLGFVDDETNIQKANDEERGKKSKEDERKPGKTPADIEEGLWRTFAKCGTVESVRVIRDSQTRVSKGVAYVQFDDENAVEAALLLEGKKFPPMLPRKLRVTRARAPKRNVKPGSGRPSVAAQSNSNSGASSGGYRRKITGSEASQIGRAGKLYGRAGAAQMRLSGKKGPPSAGGGSSGGGMKRPENFVFEGHRASSGAGKAGLKFAGAKRGKKAVKPTSRSAKRGAAFKAAQREKE